jgi:metal-dependent amidase/aminoacylase/carboxypeptidase family protein
MASVPSPVLDGLGRVRGWQEEFYRDLHAHPELSHQERRTATNLATGYGTWAARSTRGLAVPGLSGSCATAMGR